MYKGWIKIHRSLLDKPIWTEATPEQKVVYLTVLMMANHKEKKWEWKGDIYLLMPGQFITSLASLVQKCGKGLTVPKIRTALKRFEKYEFIAVKSSNKNRLITIVNWDLYQEGIGMQKSNLASKTQTKNNQIATNKNVENENKLKPIQEPKIIHDESSSYFQLAQNLYNSIQENHPNTKQPNLQRWAKQLYQLVENEQSNKSNKSLCGHKPITFSIQSYYHQHQ